MKSTSAIVAALLTIAQMSAWHPSAMAEPKQPDKANKVGKKSPSTHSKDQRKANPQNRAHDMPVHRMIVPESPNLPGYSGPVALGAYFRSEQRDAARSYFERPENRGFCPPGLAKKGHDCMPPGQAKKWRQGHPLPSGVVYYELPRTVVLSMGIPPAGYRYVRVASDILLIAIGTRIVIDALEDLVH